jgi:hutH: histidine ammonia-lyase
MGPRKTPSVTWLPSCWRKSILWRTIPPSSPMRTVSSRAVTSTASRLPFPTTFSALPWQSWAIYPSGVSPSLSWGCVDFRNSLWPIPVWTLVSWFRNMLPRLW